ncbi:hypothetical protein MHBO_003606, partial [Bonamia ostreae]
ISVRKAIAAVTPDIAKIIGKANTCKYLFEPFGNFLSDETEIRIQALKRSDEFMSFLNNEEKIILFDKIFSNVKNSGVVWEIRHIAAKQISAFVELLDRKTISEKVASLFLELINDSVYRVRFETTKNLGRLLNYFESVDPEYSTILEKQCSFFASSAMSSHRQLFIKICENLLDVIPTKKFCEYYKKAISLNGDKVVNVRITLAAFLRRNRRFLEKLDYEKTKSTIEKLKKDVDIDVRNECGIFK